MLTRNQSVDKSLTYYFIEQPDQKYSPQKTNNHQQQQQQREEKQTLIKTTVNKTHRNTREHNLTVET